MIATPRPGTDHWRVLDLVARYPGQLDAERIGERLWRPRITGTGDYLAARQAIRDGSKRWTSAASRILGRLQEAGLVERMRAPAVHEDWAGGLDGDLGELIQQAAETASAEDIVRGLGADPSGTRAAVLGWLVERRPSSVREWVGATPTGAIQRAVSDLYAWGVVVPPSFRWPTEKGATLVFGEVSDG